MSKSIFGVDRILTVALSHVTEICRYETTTAEVSFDVSESCGDDRARLLGLLEGDLDLTFNVRFECRDWRVLVSDGHSEIKKASG
jgi:hypothetical protein